MKKNYTLTILFTMFFAVHNLNAQDGLFISELADPGDEYTARFIELYNAGDQSVDFESDIFYLCRQSNGGSTWGDVRLTGSVDPGQTYVVGGSAFESFYGFAPDLITGILTGNGDDAYCLYEGGGHDDGLLHDIFGVRNEDGSDTDWEYTDSRALRNDDVDDPRFLWSSSEWTISSADYSDCTPGTHLGSEPQTHVIPNGSLAAVSDTVELGSVLSLHIATGELSAEDDIISFEFDLNYDESLLSFMDYSVSGLMSDGGTVALNDTESGKIALSYMSPTPLVGSGSLVILRFSTSVVGNCSLLLTNAYLNNTPVDEIENGSVLVAEIAPPEAYVLMDKEIWRYKENMEIEAIFCEAMADDDPVYINFSGAIVETGISMNRVNDTLYSCNYSIPDADGLVSINFSGGSDLWGNELLSLPSSGSTFSVLDFIPGDVNDDHEVQAFDAALTLQYSVAIDPMPEVDPMPWENWRIHCADVDENLSITAYDAGLILQYSAGIIDGFAAYTKKSAHEAQVYTEFDGTYLIISAEGSVVGVNLEFDGFNGIDFGQAEVLDHRILFAEHILPERLKIGMCCEEPFETRKELIRIPISGEGSVDLQMLVNQTFDSRVVSMVTDAPTETKTGLIIYPNPSDGIININDLIPGTDIVFYNSSGKVLKKLSCEEDRAVLDVREFDSGIYLLRIRNEEDEQTKRVILK